LDSKSSRFKAQQFRQASLQQITTAPLKQVCVT